MDSKKRRGGESDDESDEVRFEVRFKYRGEEIKYSEYTNPDFKGTSM